MLFCLHSRENNTSSDETDTLRAPVARLNPHTYMDFSSVRVSKVSEGRVVRVLLRSNLACESASKVGNAEEAP